MSSQTIPNGLMQRAYLTPNRVAVETPQTSLTFEELHKRVQKVAQQLSFKGVKQGDTIALYMKNSVEFIEILHAVSYIGARLLLVNTRLTNEEINYQLTDANVSLLIADETFLMREFQSSITQLTLPALKSSPGAETDFQKTWNLEETFTIMYTSGTTGHPKGVLQTYGNHWWSSVGSALNLGLNEKDCWLIAVPLFHISGLSILMRSVFYGMKIILEERFEARAVNEAIKNKGVTIISVVTSMLSNMLDELAERKYPNTFRCMLLGGGPAPLTILEACVNKEIPVYQTYGMTETSSQFVTLSPEDSLRKLGSAGKPLFPCAMKIVDEKGNETSEAGEIIVKGPNVTKGYLNKPEATKKAIQQGWFYTGDIGKVDEEGFLYVLDRRSDLIISGGENVYPAEIENVLLKHPAVKEAGVTGVADEKWGQVPAACIVVNKDVSDEELSLHIQQFLAKYKLPKYFVRVEELPRTASNKIIRRKLSSFIQEGS
ncbi:o-succinylbenzoate--CoA ligase [Priestia megaterium]|uniref:o-succinylbenzoate--CoA ligase n=1 Tax=Priestia megaterium TaxID=1404 RepID=UPI0026E1BC24|nr:o-succinylbenzoate--CoA ligase [Priestia megaterium]MDO6846711.1 o-succinylbenzoate--CoA ligase [Priestia megaterium]